MKRKSIGIIFLLFVVAIGVDSIVGPGIVMNKVFSGLFAGSIIYNDVSEDYVDHFQATSENMEPIIMKGSEMKIDRSISFLEIKVGDIMVFASNPDGRTLVSRVVEVMEEEPYTLRTQGDANPGSIPGREYPITEDQYVGKVVMVYPDYDSFLSGQNGINPYQKIIED